MDVTAAILRVGEEWPWLAPAIGAVLGGVFGSFIGCMAGRLPQGKSLWGSSRCDSCHRELGVVDLVPILSWLSLGGKCRTCGADVGQQTIWLEVISALVGGGLAHGLGLTWYLFPALTAGLGLYAWGMVVVMARR